MTRFYRLGSVLAVPVLFFRFATLAADLDLSRYDPACGVVIRQQAGGLEARWSSADGSPCAVEFSLKPNTPLLRSLALGGKVLAEQVQPVFLLTTGARVPRPGVKYIFFDKPATGKNGPVKHFTATIDLQRVQVESVGHRATIAFSRLTA